VLLTPLPGTRCHEELRPHLLPGLGWEAYTGVRALFHHPDPACTPLARERAYHELCHQLYRPQRLWRRLTAIPRAGFPGVHLISLMQQLPMKYALGKARQAWLAEQQPSLPPAPVTATQPEGRLAVGLAWLRAAAAGAWLTATAGAATLAHHLDEELLEVSEQLSGLVEAAHDVGWGSLAVMALSTALGVAMKGRRAALAERTTLVAAGAVLLGLATQLALTGG
jgi:hypothetical protein